MIKNYQPKFQKGCLFICNKCEKTFTKSFEAESLSEDLKVSVRSLLKEKKLISEVRVMVSGCLGVCIPDELTVAYFANQNKVETELNTVAANKEEAITDILQIINNKQ